MNILVTGASQNHFKSLKAFLNSAKPTKYEIYVYDLGLDKTSIEELLTFDSIKLKTFDYSKYPSYYNIHINAGEYAWKSAIIKEVMDEQVYDESTNHILLWCDAGNLIKDTSLHAMNEFTKNNRIFSPSSSGSIRDWTYVDTLKWFTIESNYDFLNYSNRNGAILGFYISDTTVRDFINEFAYLCSKKECIAPTGSSRSNHRQDQAVFTILYYKYINQYKYNKCDDYLGITIHNDID